MTKKIISLLSVFLVVACLSINAQSIKRQSISPLGGSSSTNGVFIQQTTGQAYSTQSYSGDGFSIRQGFQQPSVFSIELVESIKLNIGVYPNPASYFVTLESKEHIENASIQVMDITGKIIYEDFLLDLTSTELNCSLWSNGTYLISITSNNAKSVYKLIINK
jgi:hypothetical protein